jgi:hypothetical protein
VLVEGVADDLPDQVMEPAVVVDITDIHPGTGADGFEIRIRRVDGHSASSILPNAVQMRDGVAERVVPGLETRIPTRPASGTSDDPHSDF